MGDTTSPEALIAQAERVEAATGPDRALDAEIAAHVGFRVVDEGHPLGRQCYDANGRSVMLPAYTRSLDAAKMLVPDGMFARLDCTWPQAIIVQWDDGWREIARSMCALDDPRALTAAALRAIAASLKETSNA